MWLTRKDFQVFLNRPSYPSALHRAAKMGDVELVALLVDKGKADVNVRSSKDEGEISPLEDAAAHGHLAVVQKLLEHGAEIDQTNAQGKTALHRAVYKNQEKVRMNY